MLIIIITICIFGGVYGVIYYRKGARENAKGITESKINSTITDNKLKTEESMDLLLEDIEEASSTIEMFFASNQDKFIDQNELDSLVSKYSSLKILSSKPMRKQENVRNSIKAFQSLYDSLNQRREAHNSEFTVRELERCKALFDDIEGKAMDDYQRRSVINDDVNSLINAGAGSGKTLTLLGQIAYLTREKEIKPEEILVMMFNKKNAEEFNQRTKSVFGFGDIAKTFHSKGNEIIKSVRSATKPKTDALTDYVNKVFDELNASPDRLGKYIEFFSFYFDVYLEEYDERLDEKNLKDTIEKRMNLKNMTILGEKTDSFEEKVIADYYYLNGVKYSISLPYDYPASSEGRKIYHPDFAFPEYKGIYHEHFGIDEDGNVPSFFKGTGKKTAQEKYTEEMAWKRETHREFGTKLYETYSFQYRQGVLFEVLRANLGAAGIKTTTENYSEMWTQLKINNSIKIRNFKDLLITAVNQIKANEITIEELRERNRGTPNKVEKVRNELILDLVEDIYCGYSEAMKAAGKIDFNDMILEANHIMKKETFKESYKYIIVDEYQDISALRFNFLKLLQGKSGAKMVAVGDDWQSIFKFTGSRVKYFTQFTTYNKYAATMPITQTFRYNQCVADVARTFVTKNPAQMSKAVVSKTIRENAGVFPVYAKDMADYLVNFDKVIMALPEPSEGKKIEVMLLGRYLSDFDNIKNSSLLEKMVINEKTLYCWNKREDVLIDFSTIHASKGLEADYVIILNNRDDGLGFPSKIMNDRFFDLFEIEEEEYPFAEERRLMYVALTRTKNSCYLMVESGNKSVFIKELEAQEGWFDPHAQDFKPCPKCKTGKLVVKSGKFGEFRGCSNYPACKHSVSIRI